MCAGPRCFLSPAFGELPDSGCRSFSPIRICFVVSKSAAFSTMIESFGAESKNFVIPAFFDVALTDKLPRDGDSEEMLDIIFDNITLDLGDTVWYEAVCVKLNPQINNRKSDNASFLTRLQKSVDKTIQKALDALNALE